MWAVSTPSVSLYGAVMLVVVLVVCGATTAAHSMGVCALVCYHAGGV